MNMNFKEFVINLKNTSFKINDDKTFINNIVDNIKCEIEREEINLKRVNDCDHIYKLYLEENIENLKNAVYFLEKYEKNKRKIWGE